MAFKMKAGAEGPMKKNFPSVFKNGDGKGKGKGKITVKHNPNAKYGQTPPSGNKVKRTVYKPSGGQYGTWTKIGKGIAKVAGKTLMGGIIDPTNNKDPRIVKQIQKANTKKINSKKTY